MRRAGVAVVVCICEKGLRLEKVMLCGLIF